MDWELNIDYIRKRLVTGTVPVNKKYLTGTVDACAHGGVLAW